MTMETSVACAVRPQVDTGWLALPLSARGLVDELSKYTDDNARIILRLADGADANAVGKEIARLLCAHAGELARVKRDTQKLLDDGTLAVGGSTLADRARDGSLGGRATSRYDGWRTPAALS